MSEHRLFHYSRKLIYSVYSAAQDDNICGFDWFKKPKGLWISVKGDNDWPSWCKSENFGDPESGYVYSVHLSNDANILYMGLGSQLVKFTNEFKIDPTETNRPTIDWKRVAEKYQGIIIAPYQWSHRLDRYTSWYYGWDCASGCIWDKYAIERLKEVACPSIYSTSAT